MPHKQNGMTLIEVLVASTILFAVLILMSQAMSTALKSSGQAEKNISISYHIPFVIDEIKEKLLQSNFKGVKQVISENKTYSWTAIKIKEKPIIKSVLDEQTSVRLSFLYEVKLIVEFEGLIKHFKYLEVINEE